MNKLASYYLIYKTLYLTRFRKIIIWTIVLLYIRYNNQIEVFETSLTEEEQKDESLQQKSSGVYLSPMQVAIFICTIILGFGILAKMYIELKNSIKDLKEVSSTLTSIVSEMNEDLTEVSEELSKAHTNMAALQRSFNKSLFAVQKNFDSLENTLNLCTNKVNAEGDLLDALMKQLKIKFTR